MPASSMFPLKAALVMDLAIVALRTVMLPAKHYRGNQSDAVVIRQHTGILVHAWGKADAGIASGQNVGANAAGWR